MGAPPSVTPVAADEWSVFGTGARLVVTDPAGLPVARAAVEHQLDAVDLAASRFRPDSEIAALNRANGRPVAVSPLLLELVAVALAGAATTAGGANPVRGAVVAPLRPHHRAGGDGVALPVTVRRQADWRAVELDVDAGTVRMPAGVGLDLDATTLAWVSDRAAEAAHQAAGCGVLVELGGNVAVAGPAPDAGWTVGVAGAPGADAVRLVSISAGGLATAQADGPPWSPPAGAWRAVSVAAASCVLARVAATGAAQLGAGAVGFLTERALPARLVSWAGAVRVVGGWPEEGA